MKRVIFFALLALLCAQPASAKKIAAYYFLSNDETSRYEDEVVRVGFSLCRVEDDNGNQKGILQLVIYNKSDKIIYVDKTNSFKYNYGSPQLLYKNSSKTETTVKGKQGSINLGAVSDVLGIGGTVGTILSGTNVGGNRGTESSTTIYEDKIITIAPKSSSLLMLWDVYPPFLDKNERKQLISMNEMTIDGLHDSCKGLVRYSTTQTFEQYSDITVYTGFVKVVCGSHKGIKHGIEELEGFEEYKGMPYVAKIIKRGPWTYIGYATLVLLPIVGAIVG